MLIGVQVYLLTQSLETSSPLFALYGAQYCCFNFGLCISKARLRKVAVSLLELSSGRVVRRFNSSFFPK